MIRYVFGASFEQFSLSFPDVNKNKGVAEMAPLNMLHPITITVSDNCFMVSEKSGDKFPFDEWEPWYINQVYRSDFCEAGFM